MLINLAILAVLFMPSIMAALSPKEVRDALIGAENEEDLVKTFEKFEKEQDKHELSFVLARVAKAPEHIPKVVTCLRTVVDPFPTEMSNVSRLVHFTLAQISNNTLNDTESFAKVVASFEPSDIKPLASIRYETLRRNDSVKVLESVMAKSPELITDDLPKWIANHLFDQNFYGYYEFARKQTFQYLTSFATENVLKDALTIVKANEHYKVDSLVWCCDAQDSFPQALYNKLGDLLIRLQRRKASIRAVLQFLPSVLINLVLDHVQVEVSDPPISRPDITTQTSCLIL